MLKLLQARARVRTQPRPQRRYDSIFLRRKLRILQLIQQVHSLAITVSTNDDVTNIVDHAAQLKSGRFARGVLILEKMTVRHKITGISNHEHVTDVSVARKKIK